MSQTVSGHRRHERPGARNGGAEHRRDASGSRGGQDEGPDTTRGVGVVVHHERRHEPRGRRHQGPLASQRRSRQRRGGGAGRGPAGGVGDKSGKLAANVYGDYAGTTKGANAGGLGDVGGPSRYFPVFKYQAKAPTRERPVVVAEDGTKTAHPTVKPLALMRWLVRLVTPPGGTVLDTFAGSGATIEAAIEEGFRCIAVERKSIYLPLILTRLERAQAANR
jgi:hypothetical protein